MLAGPATGGVRKPRRYRPGTVQLSYVRPWMHRDEERRGTEPLPTPRSPVQPGEDLLARERGDGLQEALGHDFLRGEAYVEENTAWACLAARSTSASQGGPS